jgi:putative phosphoribosyl transferase
MYQDRSHAGRLLAKELDAFRGRPDVLVLALPRGGVPVARAVARALGVPFDVFVVRKLRSPFQEELAIGAVATPGVVVLNDDIVRALRLGPAAIDVAVEAERRELAHQQAVYRGERPPPEIGGKTILLVDDGLATGATMRAAYRALRLAGAAGVVVAVPVGAAASCARLERDGALVVCPIMPRPFSAVSSYYDDFRQMTDVEVRALLADGGSMMDGEQDAGTGSVTRPVRIPAAGGVVLDGDLTTPEGVFGTIVFAHGSGSSRYSTRNRAVAAAFHRAGLETLLVDLLSPTEQRVDERTLEHRFDVELLARRLHAAVDWLRSQASPRRFIGYFGGSTGAAAALVAAARWPAGVEAIVTRGGRIDLADAVLSDVCAPTLLLVGEQDDATLTTNREAAGRMRTTVELQVVPGATHLFEEAGALDDVARRAVQWFERWLGEAEARDQPGI